VKRITKILIILLFLLLRSENFNINVKAAELGTGKCSVNNFPVDEHFTATDFHFTQDRGGKTCYFPGSCLTDSSKINISLKNIVFHGDPSYFTGKVEFYIYKKTGPKSQVLVGSPKKVTVNNGSASTSFDPPSSDKDNTYFAMVKYAKNFTLAQMSWLCHIKTSGEFKTSASCDDDSCNTSPTEADGEGYNLCLQQLSNNQGEALNNCISCFNDGGIWTAVGCIPQTTEGIISTIMEIGIIIAGAIVLIMILVGAFMLSTSQGDPKKTQEAKELITSAIIGLLFIIFSVTILQFIGVSVIKIPGFGEL
jgi:hypothetical protein